jgi:hypothetical protein
MFAIVARGLAWMPGTRPGMTTPGYEDAAKYIQPRFTGQPSGKPGCDDLAGSLADGDRS